MFYLESSQVEKHRDAEWKEVNDRKSPEHENP